MKLLHTADLHFSSKPDKLEEVVRVANHIVNEAIKYEPDAAVIAGDLFDEYDGRIKLDSQTTRAAIEFVSRLASICPVLILRGTPNHDRNSPEIFNFVRTSRRVHVGTLIETVALTAGERWVPVTEAVDDGLEVQAVFNLLPTPEKSWLMAHGFSSIREANAHARELIFDVFNGFGLVNETLQCPKILVAHGMVTGATFSTGATAIGEDLEYSLTDIAAAKVCYAALGHVHKYQKCSVRSTPSCAALGHAHVHEKWQQPGGSVVCYSGSPGRLNFGEKEEKGFVMVEFPEAGGSLRLDFLPTPARRFAFEEVEWSEEEDGVQEVMSALDELLANPETDGADVRFRFTVPEEFVHALDVSDIKEKLLAGGARRAQVERTIIPKQRVRAAGISRIESLPEKVQKWGETVGEEVPAAALDLAACIETKEASELAAEALARVEEKRRAS